MEQKWCRVSTLPIICTGHQAYSVHVCSKCTTHVAAGQHVTLAAVMLSVGLLTALSQVRIRKAHDLQLISVNFMPFYH